MAVSATVQIGGNVEGNIVVGNHNFVVNTNHGTIVYQQAAPQVRLRQFSPKPPRPPRGFVNRSEELAKLENWITAHEIVLLHAPDGMGKTSLLKQTANSAAAAAMPHGVILFETVDLDGQALGPTDILQRLFDALFESDPPLKVDAASARTYLSNTSPLILFDEVPLPASFLRALPDFFPLGALLLSTDLPFSGEYQRLPVGPLPRSEALSLLAGRAGIQVGDDTHETLDLLCAWLGDISLAITICANLMRELSIRPEAALQELQALSASASRPGSELDLVFTFAFGKLNPQEQKILSTAALSPGISMTPDWLDMALGGEPSGPYLDRLKALGLLFENSPRLRLPPGFLASARRAAVLEEQDVLSRLADYLLGIAEGNVQNWEFFQEELGNLSGVLRWAVRSGNWGIVTRMARVLDPYLSLHGLWDAWRETLDSLLSAARQTGDQAVEAWALHQLGTREIGLGARGYALEFLRRALELRRALGDTVGMAYTQHNLDLLIAPPSGPGGDEPKPQLPGPPKKALAAGSLTPLLLGAFGIVAVLGLAGLLLLAVLIGPRFFPPPPPAVTQTPFLLPTDTTSPLPILTASATLTPVQPTETPSPTVTEPATLPPTVIGGSGWLAYVSDASRIPNIVLMEIVGTTVYRGSDRSSYENNPAWNPDENDPYRIAFDITNSDGSAIYVRHANGSGESALTGYSENYYPAWSPDGQKIAFVSVQDGNADIYVIDSHGDGEPIRLTTNPAWDADPAWSPDSRLIAFASNRDGQDGFQIYVMNADDGSQQTRVPNNRPIGTWNSFPHWSHDGSRLVFQSRENSDLPFQIYVMNVFTENEPVQLTFDGNNELAEWSPDDKLIAFTSSRDGNNEVYMMFADGSKQTNLTNDPASDSNPAWIQFPTELDCWIGCGAVLPSRP